MSVLGAGALAAVVCGTVSAGPAVVSGFMSVAI